MYQAAIIDPRPELIQSLAQRNVALRVRDYRDDSGGLEAAKNIERSIGNERIGEFHEQIALVIDGVFERVRESILDVLDGEMKIAAAVNVRNLHPVESVVVAGATTPAVPSACE